MNKEELTYRIPNNQIHISKEKDEDCLIWISQKAINMANTIEELQQENQKYKEVIDKAREIIQKMFETGFYNDDYYLGHLNQILQDNEVE